MKTAISVILVAGILGGTAYSVAHMRGGEWSYAMESKRWRMERAGEAGSVRFEVERSSPGHRSSHSTDVSLSRFRGFAVELLNRGGNANFDYVSDPGVLHCQGSFSAGSGSGVFTFEPNQEFVSKLRAMGCAAPDEDQTFTMSMTGTTLEFARAVHDAGLGASTEKLVEMGIHGVTAEFLREVAQLGYKGLSAQDFIDLKIHGVDIGFLKSLKSFGYELPVRDVIELRIHGVTSEFIGDLKQAGYNLPAKQIVELAIHGVTSDYIRELRGYGLNVPAEKLVELRIHGVDPAYLKGLKDAGFSGIPAEQAVELRIHGISPEFIRETRDLGYRFTLKEITDLRIQGVDGAYLKKLRDAGMKNLSAGQIEKLHIHGVD